MFSLLRSLCLVALSACLLYSVLYGGANYVCPVVGNDPMQTASSVERFQPDDLTTGADDDWTATLMYTFTLGGIVSLERGFPLFLFRAPVESVATDAYRLYFYYSSHDPQQQQQSTSLKEKEKEEGVDAGDINSNKEEEVDKDRIVLSNDAEMQQQQQQDAFVFGAVRVSHILLVLALGVQAYHLLACFVYNLFRRKDNAQEQKKKTHEAWAWLLSGLLLWGFLFTAVWYVSAEIEVELSAWSQFQPCNNNNNYQKAKEDVSDKKWESETLTDVVRRGDGSILFPSVWPPPLWSYILEPSRYTCRNTAASGVNAEQPTVTSTITDDSNTVRAKRRNASIDRKRCLRYQLGFYTSVVGLVVNAMILVLV